ncbi:MAG: tryptophan-rich sensory protein [Balneola sp.]|nr:tryptophan-rich sensory protein [Balneola sp.]MBO6652240.1 tryptophan-rich sensory protein [Balneola sp.]MBO6710877.1 tryptophan-rich sensory protein [Balneola sp.]MBO6799564.1 tryptophan-rich sensory protein [Balneola sp.]MBO6870296.1 tryptophan-rich sensory protein [Balneola sp.]
MSIPNKYKLPVSIALCLLIGFLSGISTSESISGWYSSLEKPFFNPPNWIFGPVWTFLYILMGMALGKIWSSDISGKEKNKAIFVFGSQLVINALWSIFFFGMQNPILAFIDIIILIILIVYTIKLFKPINRMASWLLYPYLVWVSFATVLNLSIILLNN